MITRDDAMAALDDALRDEIRGYFAHLVGNVAGDGAAAFKGDLGRFTNGLTQLRADYEAARAIVAGLFAPRSSTPPQGAES